MPVPQIWVGEDGRSPIVEFDGGLPRPVDCPDCPCGPPLDGPKCENCDESGSPLEIILDVPAGFTGPSADCNENYTGRFVLTKGFGCDWYYLFDESISGVYWYANVGVEGGRVKMFVGLTIGSITSCGFNFVLFKKDLGPEPTVTCFDFPMTVPWDSTNPDGRLCMGCGGFDDLEYSGDPVTLSFP